MHSYRECPTPHRVGPHGDPTQSGCHLTGKSDCDARIPGRSGPRVSRPEGRGFTEGPSQGSSEVSVGSAVAVETFPPRASPTCLREASRGLPGLRLAPSRLPQNSPTWADTLGALSRALVRVDMITLSTPSGSGPNWELTGITLPGVAVTGSGLVPIEFRSGSCRPASQASDRPRIGSARATRGGSAPSAEPCGPYLHPVPRPPGRTPRLLCVPGDCPSSPPGTTRGANVEPGGTEWGPAPPKIEQTTAERAGDPPLGREQASEGDGSLATGYQLGHRAEIRGRAGATVHGASRTSDQDGPEPGHLRRRRARSSRRPVRALERRASTTKAPARSAEVREEVRAGRRGELGRPSEDAMRGARREVSTGTN
jgi:hypothetical protein